VASDDTSAEGRSVELVVELCLRAAVEGPFFEDWEFHALFGLDRSEVEVVLDAWPNLPTADFGDLSAERAQYLAVNGAMNNLLGYPHGIGDDDFLRAVGASEREVIGAFRAWRGDASLYRDYFEMLDE
jgi:hypothetical protein